MIYDYDHDLADGLLYIDIDIDTQVDQSIYRRRGGISAAVLAARFVFTSQTGNRELELAA